MINALSFDVEEYFCVSNFEEFIKPQDWPNLESRIEYQTYKVLDILSTFNAKSTFFILGWVASRHPNLIKEICKRGHEIGVHTWWHRRIFTQSREEFRKELKDTKSLLEDIIGQKIWGFRAPSFSLNKNCLWAIDILMEEGFKYDSSIFVKFLPKNLPSEFIKLTPFILKKTSSKILWEFPLTTFKVGNIFLPISGGGYLRILPYRLIKTLFKDINSIKKNPFVVYLHPWEIDVFQKIPPSIPYLKRKRHLIGIKSIEYKLISLLRDFKFASIKEVLEKEYAVKF